MRAGVAIPISDKIGFVGEKNGQKWQRKICNDKTSNSSRKNNNEKIYICVCPEHLNM